MLPKNNAKDCQAPPPHNTIAPWFDDPSRRERNFFFFFPHTAYITRRRFDPVKYGRFGNFKKRSNPQETGLVLPATTLLCAYTVLTG